MMMRGEKSWEHIQLIVYSTPTVKHGITDTIKI